MERKSGWYDYPEYYDAIFDPDSRKEMDFLQRVNRAHGNGGQTFLEPACGSGRLIAEGARRGARMIGYDTSEVMLSRARARLRPQWGKRVQLHQAQMESFAPRPLLAGIDLAFCLVSTFRYLSSQNAAEDHLRCVRRLLAPGGVYVLGFHLTDYARRGASHERWVGKVGRDQVVCNTREFPPNRRGRYSPMRNRLRVRGPSRDWLIETHWRFRTWDENEVAELFRRTGFDTAALYTFDYDQPLTDTDRLDRVFILRPT